MSNKKEKSYKQMEHIYSSKEEYCKTEKDMDYNPKTNRCLKKCTKTQKRDPTTYKCVSLRQKHQGTAKNKMELCQSKNMDYNPKTNRCLKKCKAGHTRSEKTNKCVSLKSKPTKNTLTLPIQPIPIKRAKNNEIEDTLIFISKFEKGGKAFCKTGLEYRAYATLFTLGTLYLLEKYKNDCFILQQEKNTNGVVLNIGITYMFKIGTINETYEFNNLKNLNKPLNKFIRQIFKCMEKMKPTDEVIFIPIQFSIILQNGVMSNHANLLIYRKTHGIIDHFEPHGSNNRYTNGVLFIKDIVKLMNINNRKLGFKYYYNDVAYVPPNYGCPYGFNGFQRIEASLPKNNPGITEKGYCIMWSIFMAEMALMNPTLRNYEITDKVFDWLNSNNNKNSEYLTNVIRGYYHFVHKYMNNHLKKVYNINFDVSKENPPGIITKICREISNNEFVKYNGSEVKDYFNKKDSASITLSI